MTTNAPVEPNLLRPVCLRASVVGAYLEKWWDPLPNHAQAFAADRIAASLIGNGHKKAAGGKGADRIAIVGCGPTGLYTLRWLFEEARHPMHIDVFEQGLSAGPGMPYNGDLNTRQMLSNIASRELPPVLEPLHDWLRHHSDRELAALGVSPQDISEQAFFPRLALGAYFTAQAARLISEMRRQGHVVELHFRHKVLDIRPVAAGIRIDWSAPSGEGHAQYGDVVISSGHRWPDETVQDGVSMMSPWPAERVSRLPSQRVGVLGSSLSGIDVALSIAYARGRFDKAGNGLIYTASSEHEGFKVTLMSRKGLIPEADFWYELPLPELECLAAVAADADDGGADILERGYSAFLCDLERSDPDYLRLLGGPELDRKSFREAYFSERLKADPFDWARRNLTEAAQDRAANRAISWRSVLLRAHELFEELTPHLSEAELTDFLATLKPVFTDCYACVPHESIQRLLAMADAGHLDVMRLGAKASFEIGQGGTILIHGEREACVDIVVDARGQKRLKLEDLGFPSLTSDRFASKEARFEDYVLPLRKSSAGRIHCLALPVLLRRRPFAQGLVNSEEMGRDTARRICGKDATSAPAAAASL
jgi:uncharacterized NAD(P)/FAD-binding protein YdhS